MATKSKQRSKRDEPRLGNAPPRYSIFLNPYSDFRFTTTCPGCQRKIRQKKLPLAIHVDDWGFLLLNYTCRFCPECELLIAHQDELEDLLVQFFEKTAPEKIGNDYFVVGTVDRKEWKRGMEMQQAGSPRTTSPDFFDILHDFKDYVDIKITGGWVMDPPKQKRSAK